MKRERLRRVVANAILETLGPQHALTFPNCKRYVTSDVLTLSRYRVSRETKINDSDFFVALRFIRSAMKNLKPSNLVAFMHSPIGSAIAEERKEYFLTAPLVDLLKSE